MNDNELFMLKNLIEKKIGELSKKTLDSNVDFDGDESDEIQGNIILNMAYEYNDRNNVMFSMLRYALEKMSRNEYGICEECECEIPYKRLSICPEAIYCVQCAELYEKETRGYKNGKV